MTDHTPTALERQLYVALRIASSWASGPYKAPPDDVETIRFAIKAGNAAGCDKPVDPPGKGA